MSVIISPSILSADFSKLGEEIESVSTADWLHIDVMDGHFVPNITLGPPIISSIKKSTSLPLDVHLMITSPDRYIESFVQSGANHIIVHAEACTHLDRSIQLIKSFGCKAGVALNPHTPEHVLEYVLEELDIILVMSVNPGFGGQSLISRVFSKIERIRTKIELQNLSTLIEVDGGVKIQNASLFTDAGAHALVSGSGIFSAVDRKKCIEELRKAVV